MTVEQIELRKILTQMLADNGINRETLKGMVEDVIEEKVDKAICTDKAQGIITSVVTRKVDSISDTIMRNQLSDKIHETLQGTTIQISNREPDTALIEKYLEWTDRTGEEVSAQGFKEYVSLIG